MSNLKITFAWVVDPLVADPTSRGVPQLHVLVDRLIPPPSLLVELPVKQSGFTLLQELVSPLRGYWLVTPRGGGPGPRGGYAPMANAINTSFPDMRPLARVIVHEHNNRESIWFLDLDHAKRLVKRIENTHMSIWPPFGQDGVIEWVPMHVHPICLWNTGTALKPEPCGRPGILPFGGRPAALCRQHKTDHDKHFALERGRA